MYSYVLNDNVICPTEVDFLISETLEDYDINDYTNVPLEVSTIINQRELKFEEVSQKSESDYYVRYKILGNKKDMTVYSYFNVYTQEEIDITYLPENSSDQRLFLNGVFQFVCDYRSRKIYQMHLKAGNNIFCIEHPYASASSFFSIRIEKLDYDDEKINSIVSNNYRYEEGSMRIEYTYERETNIFKFVLFPEDMVNLLLDAEIQMTVTEKEKNDILFEKKCFFLKEYCCDFTVIPYYDEDKYNSLWIRFKTYSKKQDLCELTIPIFRLETDLNYTNYIVNQSEQLLLNTEIPNIIKTTIKNYLNLISCVQSDIYYGSYLKDIIHAIMNGKTNSLIYTPGTHLFYSFSDIDNSYYPINVLLPTNYDATKAYPLLIILSTVEVSGEIGCLLNQESMIAVEIGGRGVTMGSYIGEIAFFEALSEIKKYYLIDDKKIFLCGHSNGACASFILAQNYPDCFAGIYPCAGKVSLDKIMNLSNIRVRYLTSEADIFHHQTAVEYRDIFEKYISDFKCYSTDKLIHSQILVSQYTKKALNELIDTQTNYYPNNIHFYTDRNRCLKSYWIKLHSIQYGKKYAKVDAEIINNIITLNVENCSGFTVTIPPTITKTKFYVVINGDEFVFEDCQHDTLSFLNFNNKYIIGYDFKQTMPLYKGNGLLDVYSRNMRIINATASNEWDFVAQNFSCPSSNGFVPKLFVKYPVYNTNEAFKMLSKYSFVIIDDFSDNSQFMFKIRENAHIKIDSNGYSYLNNYNYSDYCIMQIMINPWNSNESILLISCNNTSYLKKNVFTRKLIIPAQLTGFHPYLNVSALIYDGNYKGILDYGMDILDI